MDQVKFGQKIARLRREKGLSQQQLGDRLGVSNKTVSRWENASYMPGIEMLQLLGREFGLTMEDLLDSSVGGYTVQDVTANDPPETPTLFSLQEQRTYWKAKWMKEHRLAMILFGFVGAGVVLLLVLIRSRDLFLNVLVMLGLLALRVKYGNDMQAYIEEHLARGALRKR